MSSFKKKPEKQTTYPKLLSTFEEKRKKDWVVGKAVNFKKTNDPGKVKNVKMVQRFTGKRGK